MSERKLSLTRIGYSDIEAMESLFPSALSGTRWPSDTSVEMDVEAVG